MERVNNRSDSNFCSRKLTSVMRIEEKASEKEMTMAPYRTVPNTHTAVFICPLIRVRAITKVASVIRYGKAAFGFTGEYINKQKKIVKG